QNPNGTFTAPVTAKDQPALATGVAPSDIALVPVGPGGSPDIVVTDQASGDVVVLHLDPVKHTFTATRFRADTGLAGPNASASETIQSAAQSVGVVAGAFTGTGREDLVVVNRGSDSLAVLTNDGNGGFHNPSAALTTVTGNGPFGTEQPGPVVAGYFHGLG